ncbi:hypothetical protein [Paraburkholderia caribensis]|uniref:Uncharacterized protein n=1 Tax=Paraburkholderia caribensis TaxID=75105 RepID=A0A9Q6WNX1_9BURK|nr:hypothetical protein [Paraburkholderia caribensis]MCO4876851.1 hypothetical protein [Paraburkholderia caribensis]PTB30785.1 hypothetical protein C9I56_00875 [Paraburkholderia caribensis]QLB65685.1 hypothetical protein A9O66_25345 [Paraburkholderia caribensis]
MMTSERSNLPHPCPLQFLIVQLLELSGLIRLQPRIQHFPPMEGLHRDAHVTNNTVASMPVSTCFNTATIPW